LKTADAPIDVAIWAVVNFGPLLLVIGGVIARRREKLIGAS